jgi:hypothetical protein
MRRLLVTLPELTKTRKEPTNKNFDNFKMSHIPLLLSLKII